MDALCDLPGIFTVIDDIIVAGCGETYNDKCAKDDGNLRALYNHCNDKYIKLIVNKSVVKQHQIKFVGYLAANKGIMPDREKVEAFSKMPKPNDALSVKRFRGMILYLWPYMPNLSFS